MGTIIGIDLGTTNSVVAYMDHAEPRVIINEQGGRVTPSVVGFSQDGERFVGDIAKRQRLVNPKATVYGIKRFMGRRYQDCRDEAAAVTYEVVEAPNGDCAVRIGGRDYIPQEIAAMILQRLKKSAEDFLGEQVTEAVLTVPAYFTDRQRQATRDAGAIAGLDVLRIINEPTAAALAYLHDRRRPSTIAVYDFGGGTFDISLLRVDRDVAEVLATRGDNSLGGADVDRAVVAWLLERFEDEHGIDASGDPVVMQRLLDAAERAKMELSNVRSTEIHLPFLVTDGDRPRHLQARLDRETFESLTAPIYERTIAECERALADARLDPADLDEVIMVGGSSRIPRVQALVRDLFRKPLNKGFNPDEVVAVGAAIQSGILGGEVKSVTLLDVTNFSLGIEVAGGRSAVLIPKNTTIPAQQHQLVSTVVDNQRTVKIHVLQGEAPLARDNVSLGEFELTGIQPAPRGVPRIQVRFHIDVNGIVHVSARDTRTGAEEAITIDAPSALKRSDIEALRLEPEAPPVDPAARLRDKVEHQLVALETFLREHQPLLHKSAIQDVEQALKRGRMALLKSPERANLETLSRYLARIQQHLEQKTRRAAGGR